MKEQRDNSYDADINIFKHLSRIRWSLVNNRTVDCCTALDTVMFPRSLVGLYVSGVSEHGFATR